MTDIFKGYKDKEPDQPNLHPGMYEKYPKYPQGDDDGFDDLTETVVSLRGCLMRWLFVIAVIIGLVLIAIGIHILRNPNSPLQ